MAVQGSLLLPNETSLLTNDTVNPGNPKAAQVSVKLPSLSSTSSPLEDLTQQVSTARALQAKVQTLNISRVVDISKPRTSAKSNNFKLNNTRKVFLPHITSWPTSGVSRKTDDKPAINSDTAKDTANTKLSEVNKMEQADEHNSSAETNPLETRKRPVFRQPAAISQKYKDRDFSSEPDK